MSCCSQTVRAVGEIKGKSCRQQWEKGKKISYLQDNPAGNMLGVDPKHILGAFFSKSCSERPNFLMALDSTF